MISPYLLFSYWIFIWYILYKFNIINYNPFIIFVISTIIIITTTFYSFKLNTDKNKTKNIIIYFIVNIFIKLIPVFDLYNTKINNNDILFTVTLFIIYTIYLYIRGYNFINIYNPIKGSYRVINGQTPAVYTINKLFF